eukprot:scaffold656604_cov50-Prasinocladus_malaysianus.AAC.1
MYSATAIFAGDQAIKVEHRTYQVNKLSLVTPSETPLSLSARPPGPGALPHYIQMVPVLSPDGTTR